MAFLKHLGKMKNNGARIAVVYRTLPDDPDHALVVGPGNLGDAFHDAIMNLLQSPEGQSANEFAEIMAVRNFPDGSNMLKWLHQRGHLKKVPTAGVLMTPNVQSSVSLDELNRQIAEQKGISVYELAVTNESKHTSKPKVTEVAVEVPKNTDDFTKTTSQSVSGEAMTMPEVAQPEPTNEELTPAQLRSKADKLFKEAQALRKQADAMDPPKSRVKKTKEPAE